MEAEAFAIAEFGQSSLTVTHPLSNAFNVQVLCIICRCLRLHKTLQKLNR